MVDKILVVEDQTQWQDLLRVLLRAYDVIIVDNCEDAEEILNSQDIRLAIVNMNLRNTAPTMPNDRLGYDVLELIHKEYSSLPRIVITGDMMGVAFAKFVSLGVQEVLLKPDQLSRPELLAVVERLISTKPIPTPEEYADFSVFVAANGDIHAHSDQGDRQSNIVLPLPAYVKEGLGQISEKKADEIFMRQFGKCLYDLIFPGPIHTHFNQTEAVARERRQKVRIRLTVQPDNLSQIPWEFMYREEGGHFLAVNPDTVLSRYLNVPLPQQNPANRQEVPLHMLLIIADPTDQVRLEPDMWEGIIRQAIAPIEQNISLQVVKQATRRNITNALMQHKPDIVQFVGHGIYQNGKGHLALVGSDGETWLIDDSRFANLFLGVDDRLSLVCLATCESAKSNSLQGFLGIAPQLVQRGIPAVVAMQYSVLIKTAKTFFEEFYDAVAAHKPVDWAVQWARNQISIEHGLDNREFATPVLYMRAEDGNIF